MTNPWAIETEGLTRDYRAPGKPARRALDGVTLQVRRGEVHGLLGPNGAGKTTLVKVLSTALLPSAGTARVAGVDVVGEAAAVRKRVSVVLGGERGLFNHLTARENLLYWAALYGLRPAEARARVGRLLEEVGMADRAEDRVSTYSRGMKQRVHLARGLVCDPEVLFLDEPTIGMDPIAAKAFRRTISSLATAGKTVLLTTHDLAEAEAICERVSFLDAGVLLATEAPGKIGASLGAQVRIEFTTSAGAINERVATCAGLRRVIELPGRPGRYRADMESPAHARTFIALLLAEGVTQLALCEPSLEDAYVHLLDPGAAR